MTSANSGNVNSLAFSGISNLTGGTGNDAFNIALGSSLSGTINAGSCTDTLNLTTIASPVTVRRGRTGEVARLAQMHETIFINHVAVHSQLHASARKD